MPKAAVHLVQLGVLVIAVGLVSVFEAPVRAGAPVATSNLEGNKAIVRGYMEDLVNRGDWGRWDDYFPEEVSFNGRPLTQEGFKMMSTAFRDAFPDFELTIDEQIAEGDKVVTLVTARGTHLGEFGGVAPTGMKVAFWGFALDRLESGRVVEMRHELDTSGVLRQLQAGQ